MSLRTLQTTLQELLMPLEVEIVSLSWTEFNGHKVLELLINHEAGVDVDLCATVSETVVETVDRYMIEEENFYLEVASSGAEQPIKTLAELAAARGAWIHLELHEPIWDASSYEGILLFVDDVHLELEYQEKTQAKTLKTTWDNVKNARYAVKL